MFTRDTAATIATRLSIKFDTLSNIPEPQLTDMVIDFIEGVLLPHNEVGIPYENYEGSMQLVNLLKDFAYPSEAFSFTVIEINKICCDLFLAL
jgi:hypothetical protein